MLPWSGEGSNLELSIWRMWQSQERQDIGISRSTRLFRKQSQLDLTKCSFWQNGVQTGAIVVVELPKKLGKFGSGYR